MPILSRRGLIAGALVTAGSRGRSGRAQERLAPPSLPIGRPDLPAGAGFRIGHGFTTENSWYLPGYWHCGEDWYAIEGETAGALVLAMTAGEVVFVGSDYPGRVVILAHADDLFSMYGHLDYEVPVAIGEQVDAGQPLGTVLFRTDDAAPSHLHFEVRTFLTTTEVNGDAPRYGFGCGYQCQPGPGYWPIDAPDLPVDQGWRNPAHVYGTLLASVIDDLDPVAAAAPGVEGLAVWSGPPGDADREELDSLKVNGDDRFSVLGVSHGDPDTRETSAEAYHLWYEVDLGRRSGWVQALIPSSAQTGTDGRGSSLTGNVVLVTF
ncbi:MAG: M23 family metallopeptidase [Chloroflexota bacterium]|nr:M23 family metallopeptidase [Chloroflexota bacterium]